MKALSKEIRKASTRIGQAEIRFEDTKKRDKFIAAAESMGFLVSCDEAIAIGWSGGCGAPYWDMTVYAKGKISGEEFTKAREALRKAWKAARENL